VRREVVEHAGVFGRIEQRLVLVLAVQIEEPGAKLAQRRRRRERVVE
jgi:hypothetical protein